MKKVSEWFLKYLEVFDFKNKKEINTNPCINSFSIQKIFLDNRDDFCKHPDVVKNGIRPCVLNEVQKMMGCSDFNRGFSLFECPHCHNFTRVPFTCKSRFCNRCGIIYARNHASKITKKTLNVSHRHVVFTIDSDLRYCGYEQNIPSWLIDEIQDMNEECELDDHFITGCYRCNQDTMVTMKYYNLVRTK